MGEPMEFEFHIPHVPNKQKASSAECQEILWLMLDPILLEVANATTVARIFAFCFKRWAGADSRWLPLFCPGIGREAEQGY